MRLLVTRAGARAALGDLARLRVRPQLVDLYAAPPAYWPAKRLRMRPWFGKLLSLPFRAWGNLFTPPGSWDVDASHFCDHPAFLRMQDLDAHRKDFRSSQSYRAALLELQAKGLFRHKKKVMRNVADLDRFFEEYLLELLVSMRRSGYRADLGADQPSVMIDRRGQLIKAPYGRHRWAAASVIGANDVPAEILHIHPEWLRSIDGDFSGAGLSRLREALRAVQERYSR